ncbi:hypothetical protein AOQ71_31665 [Bradyrhizobium manausense]|uniref:Uncharacterized protein n=1 Tax=Bradyrhizobium manausense TaxID=989370 RepID=A0A0R3D0K1_9BRAD|nr:hypothetical protein AOQ71_31665 [Bradyrhizobium manausense]
MALSGIHVTVGHARTGGGTYSTGPTPLPYAATASQNTASAGTLSITAPGSYDLASPVLTSVNASSTVFYAVGPSPDAVNGPRRYYDPSLGREDIFADIGDSIAWTPATLSGVHVAFSYATAGGGTYRNGDTALPYKTLASQTMAAAGTSTVSCPPATTDVNPALMLMSLSAAAPILRPVVRSRRHLR